MIFIIISNAYVEISDGNGVRFVKIKLKLPPRTVTAPGNAVQLCKTAAPCAKTESKPKHSPADKPKRYSKNRARVLACVRSTKCHPTAAWVHAQCPDLGLATVYRNLRELQAAGDIVSIGVVNDTERFDGFTTPHIHAVCERCGAVIDIPDATLSEEWFKRANTVSFAVSSAQLRLYGVCAACQKEEKIYG